MARAWREEYKVGVYHVIARGISTKDPPASGGSFIVSSRHGDSKSWCLCFYIQAKNRSVFLVLNKNECRKLHPLKLM